MADGNREEFVKAGGGPLGYGDPDDLRLRKVEKNVLIPNRLKEVATRKCASIVREYLECAKRTQFFVMVKCRNEYHVQQSCLEHWMKDEAVVKQVTDQYLAERSHFRRTGQAVKPVPRVRQKMQIPEVTDEDESANFKM